MGGGGEGDNFDILGGSQKNEYFWGMEIFVDIFGGLPLYWTIFGVILG